jgi:hypothetical protein
MPIIRDYVSTDLNSLYAIALATGDCGSDASRQFHGAELLGHVYAAPYAIFEPELALVIEDSHGVAGYCLGALDTRVFERLLNLRWWPALQQRYPLTPVGGSHERLIGDADIIQMIHHPSRSPSWLVKAYPSHLHINLLPRLKVYSPQARPSRTTPCGWERVLLIDIKYSPPGARRTQTPDELYRSIF